MVPCFQGLFHLNWIRFNQFMRIFSIVLPILTWREFSYPFQKQVVRFLITQNFHTYSSIIISKIVNVAQRRGFLEIRPLGAFRAFYPWRLDLFLTGIESLLKKDWVLLKDGQCCLLIWQYEKITNLSQI